MSRETVVSLIANTTTRKGLTVQAALDTGSYATGVKITDAQMASINLSSASFHGEWNYTLAPRPEPSVEMSETKIF